MSLTTTTPGLSSEKVRRELRVAYNQEGQGDLLVEAYHDSPGQVLHHVYVAVLILSTQLSACRCRLTSPRFRVEKKWCSILMIAFAPFPVLTASSIR